jgi:hypothetical protein
VEDEVMEEQALPDERMQLVFTYCHPALALEEQVVYPSLWNQDQIADGRAKFRPRDRPARAGGPMCCRQPIASLQVDDPIDLADTAAATIAATIAGARSRAGRSNGDRSRACAGRLPVSALDPRRLRASAAAGQS